MRFVLNKPVTTDEAKVTVNALRAEGLYRFRLVVVDDAGNSSKPAEVKILVSRQRVRHP